MTSLDKPLVVAISSRALFDLADSHRLFLEQGIVAYREYQHEREDQALEPGPGFELAEKLLRLNSSVPNAVELILLSRNSSETGLRIFNSIEHHNLAISQAVFTNGASPLPYIGPAGAHLFLSMDAEDVRATLNAGFAAATIVSSGENRFPEQLRVAFDGDAVLFSDASERIFQQNGLQAFAEHERSHSAEPLDPGPFLPFLKALQRFQQAGDEDRALVRTALITARSAPAHKRVILTLRQWGVRLDEVLFLGGNAKGPFLHAFGADIFFDDQPGHCASAAEHVTTGHVPHGVVND